MQSLLCIKNKEQISYQQQHGSSPCCEAYDAGQNDLETHGGKCVKKEKPIYLFILKDYPKTIMFNVLER